MRTKNSSLITLATFGSLPVLCVATSLCAETINVPGDHATIQAAIKAAANGDTVLVAAGTYGETINFLGKEIAVESADGAANTIIDGTGLALSIVTCLSNETAASVLRGFTLTNGEVGTLFKGTGNDFVGGAIYVRDASPTFEDLVVHDNQSGYGGGAYLLRSNSVIRNCTFSRNRTTSNGGAIQCFYYGVTIENCTFTENAALNYGGAIYALFGDHVINSCSFSDNGAFWWDPGTPRADYGGAIAWLCDPDGTYTLTINDCDVQDNRAKYQGGGLWQRPGYDTSTIENSTFCNNTPRNIYGRFQNVNSSSTICDCLADLNNDGVVDGGDLSILLGFWGTCNNADCEADLNFDGIINGADLASLLGTWGPCS